MPTPRRALTELEVARINDLEGNLRGVLVQYTNAMIALGWTMLNIRPEDALHELADLARGTEPDEPA